VILDNRAVPGTIKPSDVCGCGNRKATRVKRQPVPRVRHSWRGAPANESWRSQDRNYAAPWLSFTGRMGTTLGDQWVPPERLRRGLFDHSRDQGSSLAGLATTS